MSKYKISARCIQFQLMLRPLVALVSVSFDTNVPQIDLY